MMSSHLLSTSVVGSDDGPMRQVLAPHWTKVNGGLSGLVWQIMGWERLVCTWTLKSFFLFFTKSYL